jgi:aminotransferase
MAPAIGRPTLRGAERLGGFELSPIKAVELRASRIPGVVSLAQGIPSFDTPEPIKRFVQERIAEGLCARYSVTPGLPRLREAISESLRSDGMTYDPDREILVTVGSIEAIAATLLATIDPGDEVLVVSPTYASYLPAIRLAGGEPRFVALAEDRNFDLDPDAIADAANRRTRALLLCNPNNPTGTVFSRQQTLRMLEVAEKHDLVVITDEVYKDFVYGDERVFSAAMEPAARRRVVRVCSFSKAYGMTGWRVGFLHADAERVADVLKVHDALVTCAPVVSQYAAIAALELGAPSIAEFRAEFRRRRDHVLERLDALSHVFDHQKPSASYFVFPRVKDTIAHARDSRRLADELLERGRVALVPGVAFGPTGEAHLRLCYARPAADIDLAFDRMEDFFAGRPARQGDVARVVSLPAPRSPSLLRKTAVAALRHLARARLARRKPTIVAITGSQGKTVLKRCLLDLLAPRFRVRANPLSYNTAVGLPLAVLGCEMDTRSPGSVLRAFTQGVRAAYGPPETLDVLIVELGVRQAGDMRAHLEIVRPDVLIVTPLALNDTADHDALAVLREEIRGVCVAPRQHGVETVLLCADDPELRDLASAAPAAILYGASEVEADGARTLLRSGGRAIPIGRDTIGASSRRALAAAARVAVLLGLSDQEIERALGGETIQNPRLATPG